MKQMKKSVAGTNFSASGVGKLNELSDYTLDLGAVKIPGKVFGGTIVGATGSEFSFQSFAPGTETGFLHTHKTHEELYFFLSGCGEFQVDGQVFPRQRGFGRAGRACRASLCAKQRHGTARDALHPVSGRNLHGRGCHRWRLCCRNR